MCRVTSPRWFILFTFLFLILSVSAGGCEAPSLQGVEPSPTPAHLGLVFYSERDGISNQGGLYLLDLESGQEHRLTDRVDLITMYGGFSWSPATRRLAYVAGLGTDTEIYTVDLSGAERQRLTSNTLEEEDPMWAPDGSQILFAGRGGDTGDWARRAYIMNANGSEMRPLIDNPDVFPGSMVWSPSEAKIALEVTDYSYTPGKVSGIQIRILDSRKREEILRIPLEAEAASMRWSPDGSQLLFISISALNGEQYLYLLDLSRREPVRLLDMGGINGLDWSPDGRRVVFSAFPGKGEGQNLYLVQSDGTGLVQLTDQTSGDILPVWSPDGKEVAFTCSTVSDPRGFEICILDVESRAVRRVTENDFLDIRPIWVQW